MNEVVMIVTGGIQIGFDFIGPFNGYNEAKNYAEVHYEGEEFSIVTLLEPE